MFKSMKFLAKVLALVWVGAMVCACSGDAAKPPVGAAPPPAEPANQTIAVEPLELLKDFDTWYKYTYYNIQLARDFIGLDVNTAILAKPEFLRRLATGNFTALKVGIRNGEPVYKLFQLTNAVTGIRATAQQMATTEQFFLQMAGRPLPAFNFTDVNGTTYSRANSTNKVTVIKCWFIGCVACVTEFPELNELVDAYQGRTDIQFVSLAIDPKEKLVGFLKKKEFKYALVPGMNQYMTKQLGITQYPTHLLIDRAGTIVKVTGNMRDMRSSIAKLTAR